MLITYKNRLRIFLLLSLCQSLTHAQTSPLSNSLNDLLGGIQQLENNSDPKCDATATRLEDFMFGTPLSSKARFEKIELQKKLILNIWQQASTEAERLSKESISLNILSPVLRKNLSYSKLANQDWQIKLTNQTETISSRDKRQYSSIAYALRAILAVQQELLLNSGKKLKPLTKESIQTFKDFLDILTLTVLKIADLDARLLDQRTISAEKFKESWNLVIPPGETLTEHQNLKLKKSDFKVIKKIISQKVASYEAYNHVSMQIFTRNLQVYFAKHAWPKDPELGKSFKNIYTEAMVQYTHDLILGAEKLALEENQPLIRIANVKQFADKFIPHKINEYEDVIFFPKLSTDSQITIEAYDMDSFRDSGIHWRYLQYALEDPNYIGTLEPDPFAAELIVENVAQFGVLLLRVTGMVAKQEKSERLHPDQIARAFELIQSRINAHSMIKDDNVIEQTLASSVDNLSESSQQQFFTDTTKEAGLNFMHRSSDWLSRLIRSYAMKSESVGQLNIPPAFGGSGVAAADVNADGFIDILLLSGLGNKLFLNNGNNQFTDITREAGLDWRRTDGLPGEPRQPVIADFNNDGLQDILITYVNDKHRLYRNIGNNRFQDVSDRAVLGGENLVGGPAVVFDYDNDGLLDIYISYFGDYIHGILPTLARRNSNGLPNKLFRNKGNFQFEDVTTLSGVGDTGWGQAASHTDLDRDGWQDLIVGNDFGINAYYRNKGDGSFENISARMGLDKPSYTMNIGIADLNQDLYPDIYISNIVTMNKDQKYVSPNESTSMQFNPTKLANMRVVEANDLFISRSNTDNHLTGYQLSSKVGRGYSSTGWSWGADFFDVDNDGDNDLYVANGMNEYNLYSTENPYYTDPLENERHEVYFPSSNRESNVFFINSNGKLHNVSEQSGANILSNSRSVAYLDYDNDGDLDMILNNYHEAAVLYRNNAELLKGNWIKIKLIGDPEQKINRDAIGARIIVTTESGLRMWREIHGGVGYLSMHTKQQHFGLGKQDIANIRIEWPNGDIKTFNNVKANHSYTISPANK